MNGLSMISEQNASIKMSSREIAELVEARHDSVKRTVERLQDKGLIQLTPLVEVKNHLGQSVLEYQLIKRDTYVVVAQLSPEFTARLVDRWQELENQQKNTALLPNFNDPVAAARAWADAKESEQLALVREHQALLESKQKSEQIESMESYFRNGISPFEFVKGLNGVNSLKVGEFLLGKNWLYQDGNRKRVKAYARDQYLTEETTEIAQHGKEPFIAYKPVLLKKGAAKLYEWYVKGNLPMKATWNGEFTQDKAVGL
ncbi:Rha family transcriptional regulator [Avibacterium paragallinarum]|uniref:Rha family transcriptional regulator n=1 Tax=Avibacterium paragallinarum TaxID=728 RepID=UPI00021AD027|nr:Rha family transcriptional regulator [Avibacterium paragallinarum]QIR11141.1 phage regulatory protein [Avibacterium paragallinarum]QJE10038.1 phage regulatory protein [Avibacterium paragallinarum]QJE12233.1 phage regulatory protein [Avibacterium paragallinarum]QJE14434.1 phage regulatory protein [Avibacterium paragallinarum]QJE16634.1 phage regulatory protein [Avibacterium paragallinarum]